MRLGLCASVHVLLHKGKCLRVGTPAEVYEREVLEDVFDAPLDIEMRPSGKTRAPAHYRQPRLAPRTARARAREPKADCADPAAISAPA